MHYYYMQFSTYCDTELYSLIYGLFLEDFKEMGIQDINDCKILLVTKEKIPINYLFDVLMFDNPIIDYFFPYYLDHLA